MSRFGIFGRNHQLSYYYYGRRRWVSTSSRGRGDVGGGGIPGYVIGSVVLMGGSIVVGGMYYNRYMLEEVPLTKRRRFIGTSPSWECRMGDEEYQKLCQLYRKDILPRNHRAFMTVERVGSRIAAAVSQTNILPSSSSSSSTSSQYTYTVVRSKEANAFVLPNNHVFVMTGLFQFVRDEDELAAVLGHEMAHVIARHAGERISKSLFTQILTRLTLYIDPSGIFTSIFVPSMALFQELPHSRIHEVEADYIGLHLAAHACYDPRAAQRIFSSMKQQQQQQHHHHNPPQLLSTHPSYDTRLDNFHQWMPQFMKIYQSNSSCHKIRQQMKLARQQHAITAHNLEQTHKQNRIKHKLHDNNNA